MEPVTERNLPQKLDPSQSRCAACHAPLWGRIWLTPGGAACSLVCANERLEEARRQAANRHLADIRNAATAVQLAAEDVVEELMEWRAGQGSRFPLMADVGALRDALDKLRGLLRERVGV